MDNDSLRRVQEVFRELLEREPSEHGRFLDQLRATEPDLAREVESLLGADHRAGDFLERSPPELELIHKRHEPGLQPGTQIGPYAVLKLLGRGGMGDVYLAERADQEYEKQVAIKLVRPGADSEEILDRFWRERQILANLEHQNIARLLEGGTTANGQPYLVMEHVDGEPIDRYCDRHRLSIDARLRLFRSVCAAVEYAHRNLVVHRDLKPGNIMVTAAGVAKLLDFGIAKVLATEGLAPGTMTRTGLLPMSPEYASPEQVRAGPITTSTDVYALGLVLYELLTGQRPQKLGNLSLPEIERVVCERIPERPSAALSAFPIRAGGEGEATLEGVAAARSTTADRLRHKLAGDLDTIVMKALHKEPERRQRSVKELSEDLGRHLVGLPVRARADTLGYRTAKFVRRHLVGMAAAVLVAGTLAGGAASTLWQARRAAAERDRARTEARKSEQVAGFLTDLFRAADPDETQGDTVTVGTILERGQQRIRETLQEQPNDGTLVNGATFAAGLVTSGTGEAFSLDGVDDYVDLGTAVGNFGTGDFTVDLWVNFRSLSGEQILIEKYVETH
ncbi:MAG: serine/threonine protein kinase, partial [Planctomycetota bacterium]